MPERYLSSRARQTSSWFVEQIAASRETKQEKLSGIHGNNMKITSAVIVPDAASENLGDMALVREAILFLRDLNINDITVLNSSNETKLKEVCNIQNINVVQNILPHPRRSRHKSQDKVKESLPSLILMILYSIYDFIFGQLVLFFSPYSSIIKLLLKPQQYKAYLAFVQASLVVVKGGGFLHAYGGIYSFYYIWYALYNLKLAHRLKKPVVILPNSFGPFIGFGVISQVKKVLAPCVFISARESISAQKLAEVIQRPVPVYPDMGYFLAASPPEKGQALCQQYGLPPQNKKLIGFTVRPYRFPGSPDPMASFKQYLRAISELIHYISQQDFYPVLITQVAGPSAHENDRLAIQELQNLIKDVKHTWLDFSGNCQDAKAVYGCLDYLVGTRFHSVIFAQGKGVPCLAIAYGGNKALGIMTDMGLPDCVIPIERVDGKTLNQKMDLLIKNEQEVKLKLHNWLEQAMPKRQEMLTHVASLL